MGKVVEVENGWECEHGQWSWEIFRGALWEMAVPVLGVLLELRTCKQVENRTLSTLSFLWDINGGDHNSQGEFYMLYGNLYGRFFFFTNQQTEAMTLCICKGGGYKWYILIYLQSSDACEHLSLFLCLANHEELQDGVILHNLLQVVGTPIWLGQGFDDDYFDPLH